MISAVEHSFDPIEYRFVLTSSMYVYLFSQIFFGFNLGLVLVLKFEIWRCADELNLEWQFIKKCQNLTFKRNFLCEESLENSKIRFSLFHNFS